MIRKKPAPHAYAGWVPVFRKKIMLNNRLERDSDPSRQAPHPSGPSAKIRKPAKPALWSRGFSYVTYLL